MLPCTQDLDSWQVTKSWTMGPARSFLLEGFHERFSSLTRDILENVGLFISWTCVFMYDYKCSGHLAVQKGQSSLRSCQHAEGAGMSLAPC